jgi:phospholipid N-methyltransferase
MLEVGAGTGAITRRIGQLMTDRDELDICEISPHFADILERDVLSQPYFRRPCIEGRVRLFRIPVQQLDVNAQYDYIISGLPFTAFPVRDIHDVLGVLRQCLRPGGVLSYYEYVGFRRASRVFAMGKSRERIRLVYAYLSRNIERHQFAKETVFLNFPPAHARHLRFDGEPGGNGRRAKKNGSGDRGPMA